MFQGYKHDASPRTVYDPKWHGQLIGWLASLTLEDKVRWDLDLPQVVCEYESVFPDEIPGLLPQRDVDLYIELQSGASPNSMTSHRMVPAELQKLKVQLQYLMDRGFIDRALHLGELRFCLLGRMSNSGGMTCVRRHSRK